MSWCCSRTPRSRGAGSRCGLSACSGWRTRRAPTPRSSPCRRTTLPTPMRTTCPTCRNACSTRSSTSSTSTRCSSPTSRRPRVGTKAARRRGRDRCRAATLRGALTLPAPVVLVGLDAADAGCVADGPTPASCPPSPRCGRAASRAPPPARRRSGTTARGAASRPASARVVTGGGSLGTTDRERTTGRRRASSTIPFPSFWGRLAEQGKRFVVFDVPKSPLGDTHGNVVVADWLAHHAHRNRVFGTRLPRRRVSRGAASRVTAWWSRRGTAATSARASSIPTRSSRCLVGAAPRARARSSTCSRPTSSMRRSSCSVRRTARVTRHGATIECVLDAYRDIDARSGADRRRRRARRRR